MENISARVSGGRREMGIIALRRCLEACRDSCGEFISSSISCRRRSREPAEIGCMKVIARSGRHGVQGEKSCGGGSKKLSGCAIQFTVRPQCQWFLHVNHDLYEHFISTPIAWHVRKSRTPVRLPVPHVLYVAYIELARLNFFLARILAVF